MAESSPKPLHLESVLKGHVFDQDKVVDPLTTVSRASEKLGVMGDLGAIRLEHREAPVNGAFAYTSAGSSLNASGKGLTAEQAQASAVMELAERYSWMHYAYVEAPGYRVATFGEIAASGTPTVSRAYFLNNFLNLQERERYEADLMQVPLKWVLGTRLRDGAPFCYPLNWHNMLFSTNGLAAGNRLEEAIMQGLCEVIEREAIYRLYMEQRLGVAVEPESLRHPLLGAAIASGREHGIDFSIIDLTSDLGVPCMVVRGTRAQDEGLLTWQGVGHGCHPDPEKAIIRALSEYFEGFSWMSKVQASFGADVKGLTRMLPPQNLGFHALFNPGVLSQTTGTERIDDVKNVARPDIKDEIESIAGALEAQGYTVVVIDKTLPALGIPAVRVFIPEMRSGLNTEVLSPAAPLSAVAHEAGQRDIGMRYWREVIRDNPALKALGANRLLASLLPSLPETFLPTPTMGADYRESIGVIGGIKKHGIGILQDVQGLKTMIGPVLQMFGGELEGGGVASMLPLLLGQLGRGGKPR